MSATTSVRADLTRTVTLFSLFRRETSDPDRFYSYLADDTVRRIEIHHRLADAVVLDVGGGPGYVSEALRTAGATCVVADYSHRELHLHGRTPDDAVQADAQELPIRTAGVDVCHSSNVLEHVPDPNRMLAEMVRVVRPSGLIYLSFTNWLSPWGGHETSPWHYVGGEYAARRWESKHGAPPKNRYGAGLYRLDVATVVRWFRQCNDVDIVSCGSRYLPAFTAPVVKVPGLRELAVWNLETIVRRR